MNSLIDKLLKIPGVNLKLKTREIYQKPITNWLVELNSPPKKPCGDNLEAPLLEIA